MLTLYVICILCSIMSPWVVGVRTNCNPIIEKCFIYSLQTKTCEEPFWLLVRAKGENVCNSVSDWQVAEIDLEAEALLFSNSKRKTNEESKAENDTAIAEQQNNIGILLFIYVLHYFSACFHLFLRSSLSLWMCFHFICGTKCQP